MNDKGDSCPPDDRKGILRPGKLKEMAEQRSLYELVERAGGGDAAAQSLILHQAAMLIRDGKPLPQPFRFYISTALCRHSEGETWTESFQHPKELVRAGKKMLAAMTDIMIIGCVEAYGRFGLAKSRDGEPGYAFITTSKVFDMSPSQIRKRYYRAKKKMVVSPDELLNAPSEYLEYLFLAKIRKKG